MSTTLLALYAVVRGLIYVGLLILAGTWGATRLSDRSLDHLPDILATIRRRSSRVLRVTTAALIGLVLLRGFLQVSSFVDPGDSITADLVQSVLLHGGWAHAWQLQLGALIVLAIASGTRQLRDDGFAAALVVIVLWAQTGMGHPAGTTWHAPIGRIVDLSHLGGAGLWLGTLAVLLVAAVPLLRGNERLPELATLIRHFSVYARIGAALVVASGVIAALHYGQSIFVFIASRWGQLLLLKLAGLGGVAALGWYNWKIVTPALERGENTAPDQLRRAIRVELAVGTVMLAITTLLVVSPLPGE